MKFFSVVFALSLVFFAFAAPSPSANPVVTKDVELSKRQLGGLDDILGLLTNAQTLIGPILQTLTGLAGSGGSPVGGLGDITKIISQLTSALGGIAPLASGTGDSGVENQIADVVGNTIVQIGTVVNTFPASILNVLAVIQLDIVLNLLLVSLTGLISGILVLIGPIVVVLTALPGPLALTSVLGTLGL
ncbi:hypothetical protein EXIGLDRAFT_748847 [Exidia glandulosa HHB12029]|uniref:Uncharacterized protein n=1 Tax=Exidia glandulosa HHB12029 TaxID=1314781 RepID=A0A165IWE0_EXIGL|nr:hypothetical protein EXIGLDRAFT_748847 [Exidia glandulosa HHB12029]